MLPSKFNLKVHQQQHHSEIHGVFAGSHSLHQDMCKKALAFLQLVTQVNNINSAGFTLSSHMTLNLIHTQVKIRCIKAFF